MTYPKDKLGNYVDFTNGKTSPERYDQGRYAVFGSNGEIGRSDQNNSPESTIVIGRVGSYCGSVHFSARPCWVTDNAIKAISKKPAEGRFWYFALFNQKLHDLRSGSGQPLINQTSLKAVDLPVPDQTARLQIGELLGSLDDKIDLNRQMNETLEEMARSLFRDWFIDFGPTRRQMDGATDPAAIMGHAFPDNKAAALAPLFPARLGENGLPEGWELRELRSFLTLNMASLYPKNPANRDHFSYTGLEEFQGPTKPHWHRDHRLSLDERELWGAFTGRAQTFSQSTPFSMSHPTIQ